MILGRIFPDIGLDEPPAPSVSPAKTVEGLLGGMLFSALVLILAGEAGWSRLPGTIVWGGMLLGVLGQIGDLAESVWKRAAGAKDSGNGLPGIGACSMCWIPRCSPAICMVDDERVRHRGRDRLDSTFVHVLLNHHFRRSELQ